MEKGGFQKAFQGCLWGFRRGKLQAIDLSLGEVGAFLKPGLQNSASLQYKARLHPPAYACSWKGGPGVFVHTCSDYWIAYSVFISKKSLKAGHSGWHWQTRPWETEAGSLAQVQSQPGLQASLGYTGSSKTTWKTGWDLLSKHHHNLETELREMPSISLGQHIKNAF